MLSRTTTKFASTAGSAIFERTSRTRVFTLTRMRESYDEAGATNRAIELGLARPASRRSRPGDALARVYCVRLRNAARPTSVGTRARSRGSRARQRWPGDRLAVARERADEASPDAAQPAGRSTSPPSRPNSSTPSAPNG
jgi:hypothetical protein